jgi:HK97 family phage prohead protease
MPKEIRVTTESKNSSGVRVLTSGIDLSLFERNPIMLFNHMRAFNASSPLPIGIWKDLRVEDTEMYATPEFDVEDDYAAKIASKYERGHLRAASIGIYIDDMEATELPNGDLDVVITKSRLREISIVDVPANQDAVVFYDQDDNPLDEKAVLALADTGKPNTKIKSMPSYSQVPTMLGLSADADEQSVQAKITELKAAAAEKSELETKVQTLEAAAAEREQREIEDMVNQAVTDKKIAADQKPTYLKLAQADLDSTRAVLEGMQPQVKLADIPKKKAGGGSADTGMSFLEMQKQAPKQLAQLKADDFDAFNELYKAEFGADWRE